MVPAATRAKTDPRENSLRLIAVRSTPTSSEVSRLGDSSIRVPRGHYHPPTTCAISTRLSGIGQTGNQMTRPMHRCRGKQFTSLSGGTDHRPLDGARADDFDAPMLPGGVMNADALRMDERAVQFVRRFFEAGKPVAVICHAPWMLVEARRSTARCSKSSPKACTTASVQPEVALLPRRTASRTSVPSSQPRAIRCRSSAHVRDSSSRRSPSRPHCPAVA